jgi:hypothetical protein
MIWASIILFPLLGVFVVYRIRVRNGEYTQENSYSEYRGPTAANRALKDVRNDIKEEANRVSSRIDVRHNGEFDARIDYPNGDAVDIRGEYEK